MIELKVILHPTDFSPIAACALPYAIEFARRYSARLELLHVIELPYSAISQAEEAVASAEATLRGLIPEDQREGLTVVTTVVRGKAFVEIIRHARECRADMVIMATHGHSGLEYALLGSTTEKVVRKAPCPILTIRHPEHEFVKP